MPAKKKTVTLEQVFEKLIEHDTQFERIFERLSGHDEQFGKIDGQFGKIATYILNLEDLLKKEIARVDARITSMITTLDKLTRDHETLTQEYHAIALALKRLEVALEGLGKDVTSLREDVDVLKTRLGKAEDRIFALESR